MLSKAFKYTPDTLENKQKQFQIGMGMYIFQFQLN